MLWPPRCAHKGIGSDAHKGMWSCRRWTLVAGVPLRAVDADHRHRFSRGFSVSAFRFSTRVNGLAQRLRGGGCFGVWWW